MSRSGTYKIPDALTSFGIGPLQVPMPLRVMSPRPKRQHGTDADRGQGRD